MPVQTDIDRLNFPENVETQERIVALTSKVTSLAFSKDESMLTLTKDVKEAISNKDIHSFSISFEFYVLSVFVYTRNRLENSGLTKAELDELYRIFDELSIPGID